jgi:FkbM family methyltransferase
MRIEDIAAYFKLRRLTDNPWEIVRFRSRKSDADQQLSVRFRTGVNIGLRGGKQDYHVFNRIFVRDEYRLDGRPRFENVLDVGANVGLFAARVAPLAGRVICYEPFGENFAQLQDNTARLDNVTSVLAAVTDARGTVQLPAPSDPSMSGRVSLFDEPADGKYEEVAAVDLAGAMDDHGFERCDLLKIDVEGAEYDILHAAAGETLARVDRIYGEYHDVQPEDPRTRIENFEVFLKDEGFVVEVQPSRRKNNLGLFFACREPS